MLYVWPKFDFNCISTFQIRPILYFEQSQAVLYFEQSQAVPLTNASKKYSRAQVAN